MSFDKSRCSPTLHGCTRAHIRRVMEFSSRRHRPSTTSTDRCALRPGGQGDAPFRTPRPTPPRTSHAQLLTHTRRAHSRTPPWSLSDTAALSSRADRHAPPLDERAPNRSGAKLVEDQRRAKERPATGGAFEVSPTAGLQVGNVPRRLGVELQEARPSEHALRPIALGEDGR